MAEHAEGEVVAGHLRGRGGEARVGESLWGVKSVSCHPVLRIYSSGFTDTRYLYLGTREFQMMKDRKYEKSGNYPVGTRNMKRPRDTQEY